MTPTNEVAPQVTGRGPSQDLDALDVPKAQGRDARIEGAAPRDTVNNEQERIELAKTPDLGHGDGGTRVASRCYRDASGKGECLTERRGIAAAQVLSTDHLDGRRNIMRRFGNSRRHDFDRRNRDRRTAARSLRTGSLGRRGT